MLISEENQLLYTLMYETPDSFEKDGEYYEYSNRALGNYTGVMNTTGNFIMSKDIIGHYDLIDLIRDHELVENESKLEHNFDNIENAYRDSTMKSNNYAIKFRIWPKAKVFSMWDKYSPKFKPAIDAAIIAIGDNPTEYKYDGREDGAKFNYDDFETYENFVTSEIDTEQQKALDKAERDKQINVRALGDYMAGVKRPIIPSKDLDTRKIPGFYSREGD